MIELKHISKTFQAGSDSVEALNDVSLTVKDGEIYGIIGMSGAGKSTLVRCINLLERPTAGQVLIDGKNIADLNKKQLREVRRSVTMIFQGFNLLMQRSCLANVCFPLELAGMKRADAHRRAMALLETVGLPDKANAYPAQLSGGQQQRVAIARALATDPKVLLCDEATSALDPQTTHSILQLIREINQKTGITVIVITHQMSVVQEICNRVAILEGGKVAEEGDVSEVFSRPKSNAARRLVFPAGEEELLSGELTGQTSDRLLRVIFNGAPAAATPLIATMALEKQIRANILSAATRSVGERVYGYMLLSLPAENLSDAIDYLKQTEDISVEEVHPNV